MSTFNSKKSGKIATESILRIKDNLPRGSYKRIAEKTGLKYDYVAQVLRCRRYNVRVLNAALAIIKEHKDEMDEMDRQIAEL